MPGDMGYVRPTSVAEALEALTADAVRIGAGFTDIFPATDRKRIDGPVLDITGLAELRGITPTPDGLRIGAATTWTDIARADLPPALHGLQLAAREIGGRQIQNRGTIGGNLCNASPAADGVPPLLTLDARVELVSATGTRHLPLDRFILGPRKTALGPGELLAGVHLPGAALDGQGGFLKLGARKFLVISIAMVAVRLVVEAGKVRDVAMAVGACGPVATRLPEVEAHLRGGPPDPTRITDSALAASLSPISDVRADASYRAKTAGVLLRRALAGVALE